MTSATPRLFVLTLTACALVAAGPLLSNQIESQEPLDISLKNADLRETLQSFATISGSELSMGAEIVGSVTIHLEKTPWTQVIDRICRDQNLNCEMLSGEPRTLRVRHAEPDGVYPLPPGFADSISMSLRGADLKETLGSFEKISGIPFVIADGVEGTVSLNVKSTPWTMVLAEACRLAGCQVLWGEDAIRIERLAGEESLALSLSLLNADLKETLGLFSQLPILGPPGIEVEIDPALSGGVSVELRQVNWQQSLDLICEQMGCDWTLVYGDPPVLRVFPQDAAEARIQAGVEDPGAPPEVLGYRLAVPGASTARGTVAFTWAEPIHVLGSDEGYRARLSWIPFGPELSVVVPLVERCEAAGSSVSVLNPIVLPLEREVRHQAEGVMLDLFPALGEAQARPPSKAAASCGPEGSGKIQVSVRRLIDGSGDRPRPQRRQFVDRYLLVRPVEVHQPVAAVIALGSDLDGRRSLALMQPAEDRLSVRIETLSLAAGEHLEKVVRADGHPFELRIEYLVPSKGE